MNDHTVWRDAAQSFADLADNLTLAAFQRSKEIATKADGSWVTDTDVAVEQTIRAAIGHAFPGHTVLGEEDGVTGADSEAPVWIIDPIDGTANFVSGNPIFATLIAVQVGGEEVAAVISAPALGTRFDALKGGGSRQDGRALAVSHTTTLAEAEVSFGGLEYFHRTGQQALLNDLIRTCRRTRGYGDFWQHCLVAAGSTDVAIDAEAKLWDMAAVKLLVEAAGGRFSSVHGSHAANAGSGVSSNGVLHDAVLRLAN